MMSTFCVFQLRCLFTTILQPLPQPNTGRPLELWILRSLFSRNVMTNRIKNLCRIVACYSLVSIIKRSYRLDETEMWM